jgi:hypothetical protein
LRIEDCGLLVRLTRAAAGQSAIGNRESLALSRRALRWRRPGPLSNFENP